MKYNAPLKDIYDEGAFIVSVYTLLGAPIKYNAIKYNSSGSYNRFVISIKTSNLNIYSCIIEVVVLLWYETALH